MNDGQRTKLVDLANWLIGKAPQIHYEASRPMQTRHLTHAQAAEIFAKGRTISMDCSESVTLLYRWVGLHDPNGLGYDGAGNSGDMWRHLPHYENPGNAHPGALVTYGPGGDEHVCMVIQHGANPLLFSHGSEIGPLRISLSNETAAHQGQPRTFLDVAKL